MMKKFLLMIDVQTSAQGATHASTSYHSIYKLGGVYPEP